MNFGDVMEHENESIKEFIVRLRSNAVDFEFTSPECYNDISDFHFKDQFIRGLHNDTFSNRPVSQSQSIEKY